MQYSTLRSIQTHKSLPQKSLGAAANTNTLRKLCFYLLQFNFCFKYRQEIPERMARHRLSELCVCVCGFWRYILMILFQCDPDNCHPGACVRLKWHIFQTQRGPLHPLHSAIGSLSKGMCGNSSSKLTELFTALWVLPHGAGWNPTRVWARPHRGFIPGKPDWANDFPMRLLRWQTTEMVGT